MERTKWIERTFNFDFPAGLLPAIIERLRGTAPRLRAMLDHVTDAEASHHEDGKWSIKDQIGHLSDLEDLHISRLKQMTERQPELTAADMSNQKTEVSDHNSKSVAALIDSFSEKRERFVALLSEMDDATQLFSSRHPRLGINMRPVDVAFFTAEHDDHHLASARELLENN